MPSLATIITIIVCGLLLWLLISIIRLPVKFFFKLLLNMLSGLVLLFVFNFIGGCFYFPLGVTPGNAPGAGVRGIPRLGLPVLLPNFLCYN